MLKNDFCLLRGMPRCIAFLLSLLFLWVCSTVSGYKFNHLTLRYWYIKITSVVCSTHSTVLVFEGFTKWLTKIKI